MKAWALIIFALAGCSGEGSPHYTPFLQPACVFLCLTVVKQTYQTTATAPGEYP